MQALQYSIKRTVVAPVTKTLIHRRPRPKAFSQVTHITTTASTSTDSPQTCRIPHCEQRLNQLPDGRGIAIAAMPLSSRRAMQLDSSLPLAERQTLAAKRTHEVRHKATESKVRADCRGLLQRGEPLHRTAIAVLAGVTRQTVGTYAHVLEEVSRPTFVAVLPVDPQHTRPRANLANVLYEPAPGTCWPGSNYGHSESAVIDQGDRGIAEKQSPSSLHVGDQDPKSHHVSGGKRIDAGVNYGVHQVTGPLSASPLLCLGDSVDEDSS